MHGIRNFLIRVGHAFPGYLGFIQIIILPNFVCLRNSLIRVDFAAPSPLLKTQNY